jgi:RNA polymerase sigma-70 factor (ECF subfamily)
MNGIANGDPGSLSVLYDRHSGVVLAVCQRILGDRADAEEVLGEVFWQAWRQASRFDPSRGSAVTWLLTLARSRAIDRWRAQRARGRQELQAAGTGDSREPLASGAETAPADLDRLPAPGPSAAEEAFASQIQSRRRTMLDNALGLLESPQRQALEMAFYEGLTHTEISGHLGVPLGTIKTRIRQGLLRLKDSLAGDFDREALS